MTPPSFSWRRLVAILAAPFAAMVLVAGQPAIPSLAVVPAAAPVPASLPAAPVSTPDAPLPDAAVLTAELKAISRKGIGKVGLVVTTTDGQVLADRAGDRALTPASTMKLLTTMAALDTLGSDRTFATRVLNAGGGDLVLVGGGDPLLTNKTSSSSYKPASLQKLAKATVAALQAAGRQKVSLRYDATLFSGPTFSTAWRDRWRGWEARVAALEINSGKLASGRAAANPARTAANAFAKRLKASGIAVSSITSGRAPKAAPELARVTSTSVGRIVRRTVLISDNVAAETLSRHTAIASGGEGSFAGAASALKAWLTARGLWASGARILDGSGLAPGSRLTPAMLAAAMRQALAGAEFAPVLNGLPVAGVSGTLARRFDDPSEKAGRKVVHAKTGTLRGLAGLTGYVTTADGAVLVFAELADDATSYYRAYNWLDREAAVMARCGCR